MRHLPAVDFLLRLRHFSVFYTATFWSFCEGVFGSSDIHCTNAEFVSFRASGNELPSQSFASAAQTPDSICRKWWRNTVRKFSVSTCWKLNALNPVERSTIPNPGNRFTQFYHIDSLFGLGRHSALLKTLDTFSFTLKLFRNCLTIIATTPVPFTWTLHFAIDLNGCNGKGEKLTNVSMISSPSWW